ncbi:hypothetical protein [Actinoplanes sp. NPDC051851]|uniref:hypothetical protein n=1 Tax=Actinoplanes sp. NPDC051851 TaxID=3154753 RepID=UPI0034144EDE
MRDGGRFIIGFGQAFAVWAVALAVVFLFRYVALGWSCLAAAVVGVILIGQWHQRHARRDSAVGAFSGALLWPVLIGVGILAIDFVSLLTSDFE